MSYWGSPTYAKITKVTVPYLRGLGLWIGHFHISWICRIVPLTWILHNMSPKICVMRGPSVFLMMECTACTFGLTESCSFKNWKFMKKVYIYNVNLQVLVCLFLKHILAFPDCLWEGKFDVYFLWPYGKKLISILSTSINILNFMVHISIFCYFSSICGVPICRFVSPCLNNTTCLICKGHMLPRGRLYSC